MAWRGFKDRVREVLVLIYKFPFTTFLLVLILLFTLSSNVAGFVTHVAIFMTICEIALVNIALCQKKMSPTRETMSRKTAQRVVVRPEVSDYGAPDDFSVNQGTKSAVHWFEWARQFQGLVTWALEFVHRHTQQEKYEEGAVLSSSNRDMVAKDRLSTYNNHGRSYDVLLPDTRRNTKSISLISQDGDETDVPELEECSSSGEDEVICKTVLESTYSAGTNFKTKEDEGTEITTLEPALIFADRPACLDVDANSVDKHQILPPDLCAKTPLDSISDSAQLSESLHVIAKEVNDLVAALEQLTDAADFYTLEGDMLWRDSDMRNLQDSKRLDGFRAASRRYQVSKPQDYKQSPDDCKIFPYKTEQSQFESIAIPCSLSAKVVKNDSNTLGEKVRSLFESSQLLRSSTEDFSADALIDQELKAIAHGRLKRGEDPAFVSSTTSFREFEECWPEFGAYCSSPTDLGVAKVCHGRYSSKDPNNHQAMPVGTGCCDQPRVCIAHSRSRSKILQTDPLLSSESLLREQQMDVLWQQYNEDSVLKPDLSNQRIKNHGRMALKKDRTHVRTTISDCTPVATTYLSPLGSEDIPSVNCWQPAYNARKFPRHRHLSGIWRMLKGLGLRHCIQGSKVKN